MHPLLDVFDLKIHTLYIFYLVFIGFNFIWLGRYLGPQLNISSTKLISQFLIVVYCALIGGKIAFWLGSPLGKFDFLAILIPWGSPGRIIYGAILAGILPIYFFTRKLPRFAKNKLWKFAVLTSSLGYAFIRVGCFFQGCCWGKVTDGPHSVIYWSQHSSMPFLGLPVHPVQLYNAFLGFALFLVFARVDEQKNPIALYFLISLSTGRLFIEHFRGDNFTMYSMYLNFNQLLSLAIITACLVILKSTDYGINTKPPSNSQTTSPS